MQWSYNTTQLRCLARIYTHVHSLAFTREVVASHVVVFRGDRTALEFDPISCKNDCLGG